MKLYITIIKYGFPVEQEMRQIWDTLEEAKKACSVGLYSSLTKRIHYPISTSVYVVNLSEAEEIRNPISERV